MLLNVARIQTLKACTVITDFSLHGCEIIK